MSTDDHSIAARPPHPATLPRGGAAQPRMAAQARPPHPATLPRGGAAQPRMAAQARPPHPATLPRGSAAQPKIAAAARPPHPAQSGRPRAVAVAQRALLGYTHSDLFVAPDGRYTTGFRCIDTVPESCIESAEYIIQCIASGRHRRWTEGAERTPNVMATFGRGKSLNISTTDDLPDHFGGLQGYPFTELPNLGQGLVCANTGTDEHFNMHFGAVVARANDGSWCVISDVSEEDPVTLISKWPMLKIMSVDDFRGSDYLDKKFVLGLLHT